MPVRDIIYFPDSRLREPVAAVTEFGPDLQDLARDLADTLNALGAIGLTAAHMGVSARVMAVRLEPDAEIRFYVNPRLIRTSAEIEVHVEGSVSMPGMREKIGRPAEIAFAYQDLAGEERQVMAIGWEAAVLQHEIDQLDGLFWLDRLSRLKRDRLVKRYAKLGLG